MQLVTLDLRVRAHIFVLVRGFELDSARKSFCWVLFLLVSDRHLREGGTGWRITVTAEVRLSGWL